MKDPHAHHSGHHDNLGLPPQTQAHVHHDSEHHHSAASGNEHVVDPHETRVSADHGGHEDHSNHEDHSGHEGHSGHGNHVGQFRRLFWINLVIAIPVVAFSPMFAMLFGYFVPGWAIWIAPVLGTVMYIWP